MIRSVVQTRSAAFLPLRCAAKVCMTLALGACWGGPTGASGSGTAAVASGLGPGLDDEDADGRAKGEQKMMNQAELQQDLQRIASQFQSRITQAGFEGLDQPRASLSEAPLRQALLYQSSILDIATGPQPEVNLLDMVVFAELSADALEHYWTSERLGEARSSFIEAFRSLKADVWPLVKQVLSAAQQRQVRALIESWQRQNPNQHRVEGVRLLSFGQVAGEEAQKRADDVRGLLGGVKSATQSADQALLLANRALFLLQRVPFLLRAHARLGAREVTADTLVVLEDVDSLLQRSAELRPLISDTSALLTQAAEVTRQARSLSTELGPVLDRAAGILHGEELERTLSTTDRMSERTLTIMQDLHAMTLSSEDTVAQATERLDALVRRWVLYLTLAGASTTLFFWGCYYLVKRALPTPRA
jgi:hypothetical protein